MKNAHWFYKHFKSSWWEDKSYQGLHSILLLHLLPQLLEAGFHAVMERPQCFCDLISVDADPLGEVWNLGEGHKMQHLFINPPMIKAINTLKFKFNDHTHWLHTSRRVSGNNEKISRQPYPGDIYGEVCCYDTSTSMISTPGCRYIKRWHECKDKTNTNCRDTNSSRYWIYFCFFHAVKMNKQSNKQVYSVERRVKHAKVNRSRGWAWAMEEICLKAIARKQ